MSTGRIIAHVCENPWCIKHQPKSSDTKELTSSLSENLSFFFSFSTALLRFSFFSCRLLLFSLSFTSFVDFTFLFTTFPSSSSIFPLFSSSGSLSSLSTGARLILLHFCRPFSFLVSISSPLEADKTSASAMCTLLSAAAASSSLSLSLMALRWGFLCTVMSSSSSESDK